MEPYTSPAASTELPNHGRLLEYYVLKQGRPEGPFSESEIVDQLASGRFSSEDFGQPDGATHWTPLRKLLEGGESFGHYPATDDLSVAASVTQPPRLPRSFGGELLQWARDTSNGVKRLFRYFPFEAGVACLVLGCALLLMSYLPILIIGPALIGALWGGGLTMLRGRVVPGLGLCAAAIFVPAIIWAIFLWAGQHLNR